MVRIRKVEPQTRFDLPQFSIFGSDEMDHVLLFHSSTLPLFHSFTHQLINSLTAPCAAATRAIGTRYGEQLT